MLSQPSSMEPPSSRNVVVLNQSGRRLLTSRLKRAASVALEQHGQADAEICILLTDDAHIQNLNKQFRSLNESTDVLTFPSGLGSGQPLGDVAISVPYAERQAKARGVSLSEELSYLAIHGAFHLVGLDDEEEADRALMVREMNRAAIAAGLRPDENWASLLHEGTK
jgi:probable rRNA maturation factor